jgi:uncharacterized membrane protein YhiD involved in acid resistance
MGSRIGWDLALAALSLAFALSTAIAWVYVLTYQGMGYLRSFVQTLALSGVVSALVMLAIGDDIARGLGMVGALTLVRFRATLKDPRDLMFVFASLAVGVACGVQAFAVALVGTAVFLVASGYLAVSQLGTRREFDAVLRFRAPSAAEGSVELRSVLDRHCRKLSLIDLRGAGDSFQEFAYHLKLARSGSEASLVRELESIPGVEDATIVKQDTSLEL